MGARPQSRSEGLLSRSRSPGARGLRADRPPPRHESLVQSPRGSVTEPGQTLRAGPARVSHTGLPGLSPGWPLSKSSPAFNKPRGAVMRATGSSPGSTPVAPSAPSTMHTLASSRGTSIPDSSLGRLPWWPLTSSPVY